MPQGAPRVDAHCHLFNVYYLVNEIAEILWDKLWGNYPHRREALGVAGRVSLGDIRRWFSEFLKQIAQISHASFNSYEDNFRLLTSAYRQSFKTDDELLVYPLMMDIRYMFAEPSSPALAATARQAAGPFVDDPQKEFDKLYGELRDAVVKRRKETLSDHVDVMQTFAAAMPGLDVERKLADIYQGIVAPPDRGLKSSFTEGVELSKGFEKEVWELLKLRDAHPDTVFPFFAVDPRRPGIMDVITKGRHFLPQEAPLVSKKGPFFGIKLYPRLGYKPMDVETQCPGLYKWCQDNDIPLTFHCSKTGFPPFPKWPYDDFGDPDNWQGILDAYPKLRIDFAHFGNNGKDWADKIIGLMTKPDNNIFTDLACYMDPDKLNAVGALLKKNPILKERLMFGSDFDVMLITDFITLQQYFDQFRGIFPGDEMDAMSRDVPRAFLNKEQPAAAREAAPAVILPRIDRQSRDSFVKQLTGKNRFGWVRDLPDIRDYSAQQDTLSERQLKSSIQNTVKEMISPSLKRAKQGLPKAVDLTHWCSPIEDQGPIGACTAHAAVALVEYFEIRTQQKHIDASRLFLYKVTRNLLNWQGDVGAYIRTAMEALVLFGVPPERYMPYVPENFDSEPSAFCYAFGQSFQAASYYRLDPLGTKPERLLRDIKVSLAAGYPLMFGFTVYDSLGEANKNKGKVPFPPRHDRVVGGHAIAAVGYHDALVIQNSEPGSVPTRGALRIRNSWGPDWGDKGYGWLPYEFVLRGLAVDWWTIIKQEWVDLDNFK